VDSGKWVDWTCKDGVEGEDDVLGEYVAACPYSWVGCECHYGRANDDDPRGVEVEHV
jgi:hypothetical protein